MIDKTYFYFLMEWKDLFGELSNEQCGRLIKAMIAFEGTGEEPDFSDDVLLGFSWRTNIKTKMMVLKQHYAETIKKRIKAGKASAESRRNKQESTNQSKSEQNEHMLTHVKSVEQNEHMPTDIDLDIDLDLDLDLDTTKEKEKQEKEKESTFSKDVLEVVSFWEHRFGLVSSYRMQNIQDLVDDYGKELALYAIKEAHQNGKSSFQYIKAIARNEKMRRENSNPEPKETAEEIGKRIRAKTEQRKKEGASVDFQKLMRVMKDNKVGYEEAMRLMEEEKANGKSTTG